MRETVAALFLTIIAQSPAPATPVGHWINPAGTVIVEIAECEAAALCGWVRWASDDAVADARAAGTATLIGTELFNRFLENGEGRWRGRLFVPDLRKRHAAELRLTKDGRLKVVGCAAAGLICRTQLWTRTETRNVEYDALR